MTIRWIVCPVVDYQQTDPESGSVYTIRMPKVQTYIEPGRGKQYQHSSAIDIGNWCLCYVVAADFTPIDADSQCVNLFETDFNADTFLDQTPRVLGWNNARLTRIKNRLIARGVDVSTVTLDTTLEVILDLLMAKVAPFFKSRNTKVRGR